MWPRNKYTGPGGGRYTGPGGGLYTGPGGGAYTGPGGGLYTGPGGGLYTGPGGGLYTGPGGGMYTGPGGDSILDQVVVYTQVPEAGYTQDQVVECTQDQENHTEATFLLGMSLLIY